ncbi:hypothetical protein GCM10022237_06620 [Nocardioides ginsengisoli]|uniref:Alpha/beta hydrolase n=1 Tax=Nocardioides ginsengisoli TaxID=363868 RepID=A0ABW3VW07_9ACTN
MNDLAATALPIEQWTPGILRLGDMVLSGMSGRGPAVGAVRNVRLAGVDGGSFRVRVLSPSGDPSGVVVYFHGGGWVLGDIDLQYDHVARDLVNRTDAVVVLVNYRKAPEHPFPTAIEDGWTALRWIAEHATELGVAGTPLVVAGDSAGGNVAAVMTQWARDRGGPRIDGQILVYPVTGCDLDLPSFHAPENQQFLDRAAMAWFWDRYLPETSARTSADASPRLAADLSGLPPALVYLAEYDPLHDDGKAYADALGAAGVPVDLVVAHGQMHGFFQMPGILPGYDAGMALVADHIIGFLKENHRD